MQTMGLHFLPLAEGAVEENEGWLQVEGDLEYQGAKAEAPPCPNSTLPTPLPQQSSSSAREEEDHWEVMEARRRRRIAFENLAKSMLRYLDNCKDVKVGIAELQERVEVPAQIGISIQHVAQQAMDENGQNIFRNILARRRRTVYC